MLSVAEREILAEIVRLVSQVVRDDQRARGCREDRPNAAISIRETF